MAYLLDTNVLCEVPKPRCDPNVAAWAASVPPGQLFLSALVIGEIRQGIERLWRRDQAQAVKLNDWLTSVKESYADRIAPVTTAIALIWGRLSVPDPLPQIDGLLAATALYNDWTLVTRNTKHVARTGVRLLNPFEPRP